MANGHVGVTVPNNIYRARLTDAATLNVGREALCREVEDWYASRNRKFVYSPVFVPTGRFLTTCANAPPVPGGRDETTNI